MRRMLFVLVVLVPLAAAVAKNVPDVRRYLRMKKM